MERIITENKDNKAKLWEPQDESAKPDANPEVRTELKTEPKAEPRTEPKTEPKPETKAEITINATVISHKGCVRENNEDNFFFDGDLMRDETVNEGAVISAKITKEFHLLAICDGMGGLQGGERASSIGVHALDLLNMYMPANTVNRAIDVLAETACKKVYEDSIEIGEAGREGTTMALLYMADGRAHVGNVGDSRVYVLRNGKLYQLSTDHSRVYREMLAGKLTREQMRKHPNANVIGAYIGMSDEKKPKNYGSYFMTGLCAGDRFLLCSDGLSDLLSHEEITKWLMESQDPKLAASRLMWRALEMGGKDNTTVIVCDVSAPGLPAPTQASTVRLQQR